MSKSRLVTIVIQTPLQSWLSDLGSMGTALALIGVGVYLQSGAMQWVGAILFFVTMIARGSSNGALGVYRVRSIEAARDALDEIEVLEGI